jgi:hypothetical protein
VCWAHPKADHSGAPQSQEQRYPQDGIVNIDTAELYDPLTMVSGDISRRAHGFIALSGKEGRLLKVEDLEAQHLAEEVAERPSSSDSHEL